MVLNNSKPPHTVAEYLQTSPWPKLHKNFPHGQIINPFETYIKDPNTQRTTKPINPSKFCQTQMKPKATTALAKTLALTPKLASDPLLANNATSNPACNLPTSDLWLFTPSWGLLQGHPQLDDRPRLSDHHRICHHFAAKDSGCYATGAVEQHTKSVPTKIWGGQDWSITRPRLS